MAKKAGVPETDEQNHLKAVASLASEGSSYLKTIKNQAKAGTLTAKNGRALLDLARDSVDALDAQLKSK
ncbi:MAG: hypothetical protein A3J75_05055 [Acidobacteria bacterium RBG_16_68_9]|nr:MAG: hypothetical protein A3J75_05055 [Acidobacteria bacterium RBG_16_68_9]